MSVDTPELTGAEEVRWDLTDLYPTDDALFADLDAAEAEARGLAERYRGRLADLDASQLATALA
jgi:oligoendopeptidase F